MKSKSLVSISDHSIELWRSNGDQQRILRAADQSAGETAELIADLIRKSSAIKDVLFLGIESRHVFFVDADYDRAILDDTDALRFALEEKLPVDAELLAPVVVASEDGSRALVWNTNGYRKIIEELRDSLGIQFNAVVPFELLIASQLWRLNESAKSVTTIRNNGADVFSFCQNKLSSWEYHCGELQDCDKLSGTVLLPKGMDADSLGMEPGSVFDLNREDFLLRVVSDLPQNSAQLDFDFSNATDFSDRKPNSIWEPVLLSLLFFLVCCAGVLGFRSFDNHAQSETIQQEVVAGFKELFPNKRINGPVERILEDELKSQKNQNRLISHSGTSTRLLTNLTKFFKGLPSDIRFEFESIELREESISLQGTVKGFDEFQKLKKGFVDQGFKIRNDTPYDSPFNLKINVEELADRKGVK